MKGIIKQRRMSARDHPGELWEKLLFPSAGYVSIGWQGCAHLRVEKADAACDRAKDKRW